MTRVTVYNLMIFRLLIEGGIYFLQRLLQISCNYVVKVIFLESNEPREMEKAYGFRGHSITM